MHITRKFITMKGQIYQLAIVCMTMADIYVLVAYTWKCEMQSEKVTVKECYNAGDICYQSFRILGAQ